MVLDNDTRGWIMASVSGVACCIGACIICVDLLVQRFPGGRDWRIQNSNTFLSSSLSLSFGVMLFSSLYSMLPSAKSYLIEGGLSARAASYTLIALFLGGVVGITVVSRFIHHHMPSKVVGCDHNHADSGSPEQDSHDHHHQREEDEDTYEPTDDDEDTPLLSRPDSYRPKAPQSPSHVPDHGAETRLRTEAPSPLIGQTQSQRTSVRSGEKPTLTRRMTTFIAGGKALCDETGPCHGYSHPCGQECFQVISRGTSHGKSRRSTSRTCRYMTFREQFRAADGEADVESPDPRHTVPQENGNAYPEHSRLSRYHQHTGLDSQSHYNANGYGSALGSKNDPEVADGGAHHHHVPTNAFLSIGLQTSIAIALHKLPEGFITYATNHANPKLGFAVFMALFIHNITEGFAMALPLYLAVGSRAHAILWSSLLGGISQPLGAGIAALWLRAARNHDMLPSEGVYGGMFAVTAGIMASVALQLFSESLGITHNKSLCVTFAFVGMGILGISNALTA